MILNRSCERETIPGRSPSFIASMLRTDQRKYFPSHLTGPLSKALNEASGTMLRQSMHGVRTLMKESTPGTAARRRALEEVAKIARNVKRTGDVGRNNNNNN